MILVSVVEALRDQSAAANDTYGHRQVWVRGYVDEVVIGCGGEIVGFCKLFGTPVMA